MIERNGESELNPKLRTSSNRDNGIKTDVVFCDGLYNIK